MQVLKGATWFRVGTFSQSPNWPSMTLFEASLLGLAVWASCFAARAACLAQIQERPWCFSRWECEWAWVGVIAPKTPAPHPQVRWVPGGSVSTIPYFGHPWWSSHIEQGAYSWWKRYLPSSNETTGLKRLRKRRPCKEERLLPWPKNMCSFSSFHLIPISRYVICSFLLFAPQSIVSPSSHRYVQRTWANGHPRNPLCTPVTTR